MAKRNSEGVVELDVSGNTNRRGRPVNRDIPEEARMSTGKKKKSGNAAAARLKKTKKDAADRIALRKEKEADTKKKKKKKKLREDSEDSEVVKKLRKKKEGKKSKPALSTEEKRKKKKKKNTAGELLKKGKTKTLSRKVKRMSSKAISLVDSTATDLEPSQKEALEGNLLLAVPANGSMASEADFMNEFQHIFQTLGSISRNMEKRMTVDNVSSKDVYALSTLYSQLRETMADMRSIKDMNEQSEDLAREVFDPAAKSAGEALVDLFFKVNTLINKKVKDRDIKEHLNSELKLIVAQTAGTLQSNFQDSRSRILDVMNGGR